MTIIRNILIGTAGVAATIAMAAPAAAQGYPYGYPQQQQQGGVLGAIINQVTGGYGQYPQGNYGYGQVSQRSAISQCAAAAEQRLNGQYSGQSGYGYQNGYQNGYGNNGYQNGYGNNGYQNGYRQGGARVLGITNVEQRNKGGLRVTGVATSGQAYGYGNQGYNSGYSYNGYQKGQNRYQNGYGQNGYGAQQQADLRFTCRVNMRGQVSDLKIDRNQSAYYRGY